MNLTERALDANLPTDFCMLEIGPGSYPFRPDSCIFEHFPAEPNINFDFSGQRKYVGVDNGSAVGDHSYLGSPERIQTQARRNLSEFEERIKASRPGQNIEFIFGDVIEVPLPAGTFHTVVMNEVLSSMIGIEGAKLLIGCAAKLLVKGGLLVTREAFTPEFMHPTDAVEQMLGNGFSEAEAVTHITRPDEYDALRDYYGQSVHDFEGRVTRTRADRYFGLAIK